MEASFVCVQHPAISVPSTASKKKMSKRTQEDSGEERVTAKKKRRWIWSHDTVWGIPTCLPRLHRKARGKPNLSKKVLLGSVNVQETSLVRLVLGASSSNCSEWNIDDKWSSQVRKSGEMSNARTVRRIDDKFVIDDNMDSDTATESNLSLKSRSFLNRVIDRLRKMLNCLPDDAMKDIDKRSMIWRMFLSSTLEASVFLGKNYSDNLHSIRNTGENFTLKQMFDISHKLRLEQSYEIFGVSQISWEDSPWEQLSLVNDEEVIGVSHAKVYVFSDSVLRLGKVIQNPTSSTAWEQKLDWFKDALQYRTLDTIDGEPMEFKWNIFPGFYIQVVQEVETFMNKMGEPGQFQGRIIFMSMFNDFVWRHKDNEKECIANPTLVPLFAKRFPADRDQKQSVKLLTEKDQEENGTQSLNWWWSNSEKADTQFSEPRLHYLEERSEAKEVENYLHASAPMVIRLKLFFAQSFLSIISVSTEQSQICVKKQKMSIKHRETCYDRAIRLIFRASRLVGNDTHILDWDSCTKNLMQKYKERVENFSQPDQLKNFVLMQDSWKQLKSDNTSWQSTLTSSYNLQNQWHLVSILYHEVKNQLTRKVGFEGTPKLDPCWKSQPVTFKVNMEWKLELNL